MRSLWNDGVRCFNHSAGGPRRGFMDSFATLDALLTVSSSMLEWLGGDVRGAPSWLTRDRRDRPEEKSFDVRHTRTLSIARSLAGHAGRCSACHRLGRHRFLELTKGRVLCWMWSSWRCRWCSSSSASVTSLGCDRLRSEHMCSRLRRRSARDRGAARVSRARAAETGEILT